jgi:hypothetical protein
MTDTPLYKKIGIKPGHRVLILYPPQGFVEMLGTLPEGAMMSTQAEGQQYDVVVAFTTDKAEVDSRAPQAIESLKPGGVLWFAHPKKSGKIKTDISRDVGWDVVRAEGLETVATISIDDTWSGVRFRPSEAVKSRQKKA